MVEKKKSKKKLNYTCGVCRRVVNDADSYDCPYCNKPTEEEEEEEKDE